MERCPVCRARRKGGAVCHRCGSDLSLALAAQQRSQAWQRRAVQSLGEGDLPAAARALAQALRLKRTPLAAALHAFASRAPATATTAPPVRVEELRAKIRQAYWGRPQQ